MIETPCESNTNTAVDKHILTENFVLWYYYADDEGIQSTLLRKNSRRN